MAARLAEGCVCFIPRLLNVRMGRGRGCIYEQTFSKVHGRACTDPTACLAPTRQAAFRLTKGAGGRLPEVNVFHS